MWRRASAALLALLALAALEASAHAAFAAAEPEDADDDSRGGAAGAGDAAASAANPFSRAGLQGRRAHLLAEERAKHVDFAAKWAVQEALDAAALGDSGVLIRNIADFTPSLRAADGWQRHHFPASSADVPHTQLLQPPQHNSREAQQLSSEVNRLQLERNQAHEDYSRLQSEYNRLQSEIDQLLRYSDHGEYHGGITLTPKVLREMVDEKQKEFDAAQVKVRRFKLEEARMQEGFIARSCLGDVARAVAAALPGVSVEVEGVNESLRISWD
jgi:hypothetical protein